MKVGFAVSDLVRGGGAILIVTYANALAAMGHEVFVAVDQPGGDLREDLAPEIEVVDRSQVSSLPTLDVAIGTWWVTLLWVTQIPALAYGQFMQSVEDRFYLYDNRARARARVIQTLGWPTITESAWIRDYLGTVSPGTAVEYVRNGVDKQRFPPTLRPARPAGPLRVVVEGSAAWFKGMRSALEGLARVRVPIEVTYAASQGDEVEGVDELISANPLIVEFDKHRNLPQSQFAALLSGADVFVKLSRLEGMPGPPLEAMHVGCAVIANPVWGIEEYAVHGHNCLLIPFDDTASVANWLGVLTQRGDLLAELRLGAHQTALAWPSSEETAVLFAEAVERIARLRYRPDCDAASMPRIWEAYLSEALAREPRGHGMSRRDAGIWGVDEDVRLSQEPVGPWLAGP